MPGSGRTQFSFQQGREGREVLKEMGLKNVQVEYVDFGAMFRCEMIVRNRYSGLALEYWNIVGVFRHRIDILFREELAMFESYLLLQAVDCFVGSCLTSGTGVLNLAVSTRCSSCSFAQD